MSLDFAVILLQSAGKKLQYSLRPIWPQYFLKQFDAILQQNKHTKKSIDPEEKVVDPTQKKTFPISFPN